MKYLFLLSGDYIDLAKEEVTLLFDVESSKLLDMLLVIDLDNNENSIKKLSKRLALTKNVYRLLFECKINELIGVMENYDWGSIYKDNFCLRIHNFDGNKYKKFSEKNLAKYIWHSVNKPKVNLENTITKIELFIIKNKVYCGLLIFQNEENFESRKAHLRPFPHPSSLHPKIARALVNITDIKENEILLDPFCGTGGFLIEAGLMGIEAIGYDIYKTITKGCMENLEHYKIKNYKIKNKNALNIVDKFDCLVTDLPYGLNSNALIKYEKDWKQHRLNKKIQKKDFTQNLEQFYLKFLKALRKRLKKKAIIVFPSYVNYKKLLKLSKFRIKKEFSNYVHRSLTRKIVLIKNR